MEIVNVLLVLGTGTQILCIVLGGGLWLFRHRLTTRFWPGLLLATASIAAFFAGLMPGAQLIHFVAIGYMPQCLAEEDCRRQAIYCATWLSKTSLLLAIQIVLFCAAKPLRQS